MQVIGNNCCGGYFYILSKERFNNPFIWSLIDADDFIRLICNYDKIDFDKINFTELHLNRFKYHSVLRKKVIDNKHIIGLDIDNKFTIYYTHYLYDASKKTPTKIDIDIFYYKNYEYVYKKYIERKARVNKDDKPVFFIITYKKHNWTQDKVNKLLSLNTKYKIILITQYKIKTKPNNIYVINDRLIEGDPNKITKKYFEKIRNIITG